MHSPALGPRGCGAPTYSHSWRGRSWFGLNLFQLLWCYVGQAISDGCRVRGLQGRASRPWETRATELPERSRAGGRESPGRRRGQSCDLGPESGADLNAAPAALRKGDPFRGLGMQDSGRTDGGGGGGRGTGWVAGRRCADFACLLRSSLCELGASGPSRGPHGRGSKACNAAPSPPPRCLSGRDRPVRSLNRPRITVGV